MGVTKTSDCCELHQPSGTGAKGSRDEGEQTELKFHARVPAGIIWNSGNSVVHTDPRSALTLRSQVSHPPGQRSHQSHFLSCPFPLEPSTEEPQHHKASAEAEPQAAPLNLLRSRRTNTRPQSLTPELPLRERPVPDWRRRGREVKGGREEEEETDKTGSTTLPELLQG